MFLDFRFRSTNMNPKSYKLISHNDIKTLLITIIIYLIPSILKKKYLAEYSFLFGNAERISYTVQISSWVRLGYIFSNKYTSAFFCKIAFMHFRLCEPYTVYKTY